MKVNRASPKSTSASPLRGRTIEGAGLGVVVLAMAIWRFGRTTADPDLWGHLTTGLETLAAGSYRSVDSWSYLTAGQPWVNHPWLGQTLMAYVYDVFDTAGLVALKACIALSIVATLYWWMIRKGLAPLRAAIVGLLVVLVLTPTFGTFRPQVFTVLAAVVLFFVMVAVEEGRVGALWVLPPLFIAWANLHGGYLAGLAILGTWAVSHAWLDGSRHRFAPLLGFVTSVLASFLNPVGWKSLAFLLETATVPRPEIQDWQAIDLTSAVGVAYLALAGVTAAALVIDRRNVNWALGLPLVALMVAPLLAWRHLQLFAAAVVVLGATHIRELSNRIGLSGRDDQLDRVQTRWVAGALIVAVVLATAGLGRFASCIGVEAQQFEVPQRAATVWATVNPSGNVVVPFNWGEYVRWHFGPEARVSIDGRRETIYSEEVYQLNLDFMEGRGNWEELLELRPADWVLAPSASPVIPLMRGTGDWEVVYEDPVATIFSKRMVELDQDDAIPIDGNGSCYPAGPTDRSVEDF